MLLQKGGWHPSLPAVQLLDARRRMTENLWASPDQETIVVDAPHVETPQEVLDRLHCEVAELRASRRRILLAGDDERRAIERALHTGVQQLLVALSVKVQLARHQASPSSADVAVALEEIEGEVRLALDESTRLADRISPPLLEMGGLSAALRAAIVNRGLPATVDVTLPRSYAPEITRAAYASCLDLIEGSTGTATATVRETGGALVFDIAAADFLESCIERVHDRLETFGGRLTAVADDHHVRISGSLPLSAK